MKMPKPTEGGNFEPVPEGMHLAICYQVIDLGTQETTYNGESKEQHKVLISWELPEERVEIDGESKPGIIHNRYTLSSHEKATLRQHLECWRGRRFTEDELDPENPKGFDIKNLIGKACQITVVHKESKGKTYANIRSINPKPKGFQEPETENRKTYFAMEHPGNFDRQAFGSLPDWMQDIIKKSPQYQQANARDFQAPVNDYDGRDGFEDGDIPF